MSKRKAIVVGGSLGGLLVGNMLHRSGWGVQVFERSYEELSGRGAGIVTHPELFEGLRRAGAVVDESIGVAVDGRITLDSAGNRLGELPMPQILTAWGRLHHLLAEAFPKDRYILGKEFQRVESSANSVAALFTDGERVEADLLVGADGIRSTVRRQYLPDVNPLYAGYVAWRGLVDEAALSPRAHAAIFGKFGFCLPPREQLVGYPVAGKNNSVVPGQRRYNFVWYRPVDEALDLPKMLTDDSGRYHPNGIPPQLVSRQVLAEVKDAARAVLSPEFAEVVLKTEQLFFQPIFDVESPTIAFDRVALLGDAAFVARPHCGAGVSKAAGDAMSLVEAVSQADFPITQALTAYNRVRTDFGRFIVNHARHLGAYMQAQLKTPEEQLMAERYRTPEAVMRETAVPAAAA